MSEQSNDRTNWAPNDPNAYGYNRSLHSGGELSVKGKMLTMLFGLDFAD